MWIFVRFPSLSALLCRFSMPKATTGRPEKEKLVKEEKPREKEKEKKFLRQGRCVVVTAGRYAGKKAVILKSFDEGQGNRQYGHALVLGVERPPLRITRKMNKKKQKRRSHLKPFMKLINFNHLFPTRYNADIPGSDKDKKKKFPFSTKLLNNPKERRKTKQTMKANLEDRYKSGRLKWLFTKLPF